MKKKVISIIIILIIAIIIALGAYFVIQKNNEEKRNYEIAQITDYKYYVIKEEDKYGVIDSEGNKIIETQYDNVKIPNPEQAVFVCYEGEETKVLNENSEEILTQYKGLEPLRLKNILSDLMYEKTVLKYSENGKYGILDFTGKKLTKAIYDEIDTLQSKEGELLVKIENKYGVININGATLVKTEYDKIESDKYYDEELGYKNAGYIVTQTTDEGYRYGYVNSNGKEIIEPKYNELSRITEISNSNDVYIICAENGKYGLLKNNSKIINNDYQSLVYNSSNKTIIALKGKRYGAFSLDGKNIVPFEYKQIDSTGDYLYATSSDEIVTVFDNNGEKVDIDQNLKILNTENESYKIYIQAEEGKTIYNIYKNGEQVTKNSYTYIQYLFDNYFIACDQNGKLGVIDDNENTKIEFNYNSIQRIDDTKMIETQNTNTKITEIYSSQMNKICELIDASIENKGEYIKLYNENETKYISKEEKEVTNIEDKIKENNPEFIGQYHKVVYGNGEIYYTK